MRCSPIRLFDVNDRLGWCRTYETIDVEPTVACVFGREDASTIARSTEIGDTSAVEGHQWIGSAMNKQNRDRM